MATATLNDTDALLLRDWAHGYESQPREFSFPVEQVEGQIPQELHGTLFRNGPGLLDIAGAPIHHPFDGDGMVVAFSFRDGQAHYTSRFVRTEGFVAEQRSGKILYRGVFGTQRPGGWPANLLDLRLKNVANTGVVAWGERLWALWEAGEPHRLDPHTLATLGPDTIGGLLRPGDAFAAHYHIDPSCAHAGDAPCLVNFGVKPGLNSLVNIFEFARNGSVLRHNTYEIEGFALLHDMAITPDYCIFLRNPVRYDPIPYALGLQSAGQGLVSLPGKPSHFIVIPRDPTAGQPRSFAAPNGFVWHHANAFADGETLVIDSIWYDSYVGIDPQTNFRKINLMKLPQGRLVRSRLNLRSGKVERSIFDQRNCEFPVLHPAKVGRPYRYAYLGASERPTGNAPLQAIWKVDMETGAQQLWSAGPRGFVSEPIFAPRPRNAALAGATTPDAGDPLANSMPGEDDGWLLTLVYDAERHSSSLVILDARDLTRGPLATLHLGHHIPHGLHGSFTSRYFGR